MCLIYAVNSSRKRCNLLPITPFSQGILRSTSLAVQEYIKLQHPKGLEIDSPFIIPRNDCEQIQAYPSVLSSCVQCTNRKCANILMKFGTMTCRIVDGLGHTTMFFISFFFNKHWILLKTCKKEGRKLKKKANQNMVYVAIVYM